MLVEPCGSAGCPHPSGNGGLRVLVFLWKISVGKQVAHRCLMLHNYCFIQFCVKQTSKTARVSPMVKLKMNGMEAAAQFCYQQTILWSAGKAKGVSI